MSDVTPAEPTPGQAAREAFGELGADWYPGTPWNKLPEALRAQWEAAAAAVAAPLNAEIASLREQLAQAEALVAVARQERDAVYARARAYRAALEQVKRTAEYFGHKGELNIATDALEGGG